MRLPPLVLAGVLLLPAPVAAQVYRWVDAQGNVHYSQTPPPGQAPAETPPAAEEPAKPATAPKAAPAPKKAAGPAEPARPATPSPAVADDVVDRARALIDHWTGQPGLLKQAFAELKSVLDKDPKNARALTQMARVLYKTGYTSGDDYDPQSLQRAAALLDTALTIDPKLVEAHVTRGYVLLFSKDAVGARRAALEAERLAPSDYGPSLLLADVAQREKKYDEAAQRATKAIGLARDNYDKGRSYAALARAERGRKDLKAAEVAYQAVIRHEPDSAWARVNYASFLSADVDDQDRAIATAKDALRLMDFGVGHRTLARAAYRKAAKLAWTDKNWDAAGLYFEMATEHDPENANARYGLGMYYWFKADKTRDRGLIDKAGLELQAALAAEPQHKEARKAFDDLTARGWKPPAAKK